MSVYERLAGSGLPFRYEGRWIVHQDGRVDVVYDRHGVQAKTAPPDGEMFGWLDKALPEAEARAATLLRRGDMHTRKAKTHVLYEDGVGVLVGDTNASAGYLYVVGFRWADLPAPAVVDGVFVARFPARRYDKLGRHSSMGPWIDLIRATNGATGGFLFGANDRAVFATDDDGVVTEQYGAADVVHHHNLTITIRSTHHTAVPALAAAAGLEGATA